MKLSFFFKLLFAIFFVCSPFLKIFAFHQITLLDSTSYTHGIAWSIVNPKNGKTSYIIGTIHTLDTNYVEFPIAQLEKLALSADMLLFETVSPIGDEELSRDRLIEQKARSFILTDTSLSIKNNLSADRILRLRKIIENSDPPLSLMTEMLDKVDPSLLCTMLLLEYKRKSPFFDKTTFYPEGHFRNLGYSNSKSMKGLEEYGSVTEVLKSNEDNFKDNIMRLEKIIDGENFDDIFKYYISQEITKPKINEDPLLVQRNSQMVSRIESHIDGFALFIMVGVAHLSGEFGILNLLDDKGYIVTRFPVKIRAKP